MCRGHAPYPAFAPDTPFLLLALWKWQLGFYSFCVFLSRICPNGACTQLFLVPYSFFIYCRLRRSLSICKHFSTAAKGPSSQLPACLSISTAYWRYSPGCLVYSWLPLIDTRSIPVKDSPSFQAVRLKI